MKELKGTKTEANLMTAFAGESQARNKYTYYASKAKKTATFRLQKFLKKPPTMKKEHAKIWFKLLHDGEIADTATNLLDAAEGENYEWTDITKTLPSRQGGGLLTILLSLFEQVAKIEKEHEERYRKLLSNVNDGLVFSKDGEAIWVCSTAVTL